MKRVSRTVGVVDVATAAGVSVGTVSNVLNHPELVADATRERVLDAADRLGFVRNESARLLRVGRSSIIGLVVLDVGNPFFTDVARGAEESAEEQGYSLFLCNTEENPKKEQRYLELLEQQRVHGVLITPTDEAGTQLRALQERGTPVVLVDRAAGIEECCSVSVDDLVGGALVMEHLLANRHRRLAFAGGPFSLTQVRDRHDGFMKESGDARVTVFETTALNVAQGRVVGEEIASMPSRRRPTAVFCANDLLALGVLQSLTQASLSVPGDVALVGYDDIDYAAAAAIPLSSVRQPREQLGRAAIELLFAEREDKHQHRTVEFKPELVVRTSSQLRRR